MKGWSKDELTVLLGLFVAQPFKAGDDQSKVCRRIAREFGRKPGAVDSQWRNVKYHLFRLDLYGVPDRHVGANVKRVIDRYRKNLGRLRDRALRIMRNHGWDLDDLL
jgi:hypothetical protein